MSLSNGRSAGRSRYRGLVKRTLLALALASAVGGCTKHEVLRVYDGTPSRERFISARAYALHAHAAEAEARGEQARALDLYRRALQVDPDNVEAYARLVTLHCRRDETEIAREMFAEAVERAPEHEESYFRWAQCQADLAHADKAESSAALAAARRAAEVAPSDERVVLLLVDQLLSAQRSAEALVWLRGLLRRQPGLLAGWRVLASRPDPSLRAWRERAQRELLRLGPDDGSVARPLAATPNAAVDAALLDDDVARGRDLLREAGSAPALLAVRALKLGQLERARQLATLRVNADPHDLTARVVLTWTLDQAGDATQAAALLYRGMLHRGLLQPPPQPLSLDATSRELLARLLLRHIGAEGAQPWLGGAVLGEPPRAAADAQRRSPGGGSVALTTEVGQ